MPNYSIANSAPTRSRDDGRQMPAAAHARRFMWLGVLALLLLWQNAAVAQSSNRAEVVVVTLKTNGLYLSHARIKPGPVRFLIENCTLLHNPVLQIKPADAAKASIATDKPTNSDRGSHSWSDTVLTPGSYSVSIAAVPNVQAQLTVTP